MQSHYCNKCDICDTWIHVGNPPAHIMATTKSNRERLDRIINQTITRRKCEVAGHQMLTGKAICELPATEKFDSEIRCPLGKLEVRHYQTKTTT